MVAKESLFLLHHYLTSPFLNLVPLKLQEPQTQCPADTVAEMKSGFHNNRPWLTLGQSESTSTPPFYLGICLLQSHCNIPLHPNSRSGSLSPLLWGPNRHIQPSHRKPIPGYNTLEFRSPCDLGTICLCLKDGFSFSTFC